MLKGSLYLLHFARKMLVLLQLVNIPIEGIRLLDAVCLLLGKRRRARLCSGVVSAWCLLL